MRKAPLVGITKINIPQRHPHRDVRNRQLISRQILMIRYMALGENEGRRHLGLLPANQLRGLVFGILSLLPSR